MERDRGAALSEKRTDPCDGSISHFLQMWRNYTPATQARSQALLRGQQLHRRRNFGSSRNYWCLPVPSKTVKTVLLEAFCRHSHWPPVTVNDSKVFLKLLTLIRKPAESLDKVKFATIQETFYLCSYFSFHGALDYTMPRMPLPKTIEQQHLVYTAFQATAIICSIHPSSCAFQRISMSSRPSRPRLCNTLSNMNIFF